MRKQKAIEILERGIKNADMTLRDKYGDATCSIRCLENALEELKKSDENDRIRIKDEAIEEAMKWILCDDIICMLKKAREA